MESAVLAGQCKFSVNPPHHIRLKIVVFFVFTDTMDSTSFSNLDSLNSPTSVDDLNTENVNSIANLDELVDLNEDLIKITTTVEAISGIHMKSQNDWFLCVSAQPTSQCCCQVHGGSDLFFEFG
jgi:hypothetical protein